MFVRRPPQKTTAPVLPVLLVGLAGQLDKVDKTARNVHKKDQSRIKRAQKRYAPSWSDAIRDGEPLGRNNVRQRLKGQMKKFGRYGEFVSQHFESWTAVHSEICNHEKKGEWQPIVDKATKQIQELDKAKSTCVLQKEQCVPVGFVLPVEKKAFFNRAQARMELNILQRSSRRPYRSPLLLSGSEPSSIWPAQ
jgi:hypothetical protein